MFNTKEKKSNKTEKKFDKKPPLKLKLSLKTRCCLCCLRGCSICLPKSVGEVVDGLQAMIPTSVQMAESLAGAMTEVKTEEDAQAMVDSMVENMMLQMEKNMFGSPFWMDGMASPEPEPKPKPVREPRVLYTNLPHTLPRDAMTPLKQIGGTMLGDKLKPRFCSVCVVDDVVVAADCANFRLKTFADWRCSLDCNFLTGVLELPDEPTSVSVMANSDVAVAVPYRREIYFLQIDRSVAHFKRTLTSEKGYRCVADAGTELIALSVPTPEFYHLPSAVDVLDFEGTVLRTLAFSEDIRYTNFKDLTLSPSGLLYLTDTNSSCVFCVTTEGKEMYRYLPSGEEKFNSLSGIHCTSSSLFLTDFDSDSLYKVEYDVSGPTTRQIFSRNRISRPTGVFSGSDGLVFVSSWGGTIRVFQIDQCVNTDSLETAI